MDGVTLKRCTNHDQVVVRNAVGKHILMVTVDDNVETVILIVRLLEILNKSVVRLEASLFRLLLVQVDHVSLDEL